VSNSNTLKKYSVLANPLTWKGIRGRNLIPVRMEEAGSGNTANSIGLTSGGDKVTNAKAIYNVNVKSVHFAS
jgi:hypothetical protein